MKKVLIDIKDAVVSDRDPSESSDTLFTKSHIEPEDTSSVTSSVLDASSCLPPASLFEDTPTSQVTADEPEDPQDGISATGGDGADSADTNNNIRYKL